MQTNNGYGSPGYLYPRQSYIPLQYSAAKQAVSIFFLLSHCCTCFHCCSHSNASPPPRHLHTTTGWLLSLTLSQALLTLIFDLFFIFALFDSTDRILNRTHTLLVSVIILSLHIYLCIWLDLGWFWFYWYWVFSGFWTWLGFFVGVQSS